MTEGFLCNAMAAYGSAVYRLALCRTQSVPDAEDVYQDVFLKLLGQRAEDWDGEHLKAWLIRTALNRCADLHRFRLRRAKCFPRAKNFLIKLFDSAPAAKNISNVEKQPCTAGWFPLK